MKFFTNFEDFEYTNKYVRCEVKFSRFGGRFREAQRWLDTEVLKKMQPFIPRKTGHLRNMINATNYSNIGTGKIRASMAYGDKLYCGFNPLTGRYYRWTNPLTQPYWGQYTIKTYKPELIRGVRRILLRGK